MLLPSHSVSCVHVGWAETNSVKAFNFNVVVVVHLEAREREEEGMVLLCLFLDFDLGGQLGNNSDFILKPLKTKCASLFLL